ncbi:MAG: hypothetical protein GEU75_07255 [Dehalococcoidia bacterium]|nr:hypothetical protein [Dehalococcoidia bacterium]
MLGRSWTEPASYGQDEIAGEVAYIAYHFHWPLEQIMNLEHSDRRRWAREISEINQRMNEESGNMAVL